LFSPIKNGTEYNREKYGHCTQGHKNDIKIFEGILSSHDNDLIRSFVLFAAIICIQELTIKNTYI